MIPDPREPTCWNYSRRSGHRQNDFILAGAQAIKFAVKEAQGTKDVDFILNVIALRAEPLRLEAVSKQLGYAAIAAARNFQFKKDHPQQQGNHAHRGPGP